MSGLLLGLGGCALFASRPLQEMSDTQAAVRAAQEVQADTLSPDLYRQAIEFWEDAKREYKYKNFAEAKTLADKARNLAEQSEYDAIRAGGNRSEAPPDPMNNPTAQPVPPAGE